MKQIKTIIFPLLLLTFLTGCSSMSKDKPQSEVTAKTSQQSVDNKFLPQKAIPSSTNSCIDDMTLLKQTNYNQYSVFVRQYGELMDEYHFLRKNDEIMDKDTKQYLSNILTIKYETLCSKIKFSSFLSVKEQIKKLKDI